MNLKEINEFIEEETKRLKEYYNDKDEKELAMAHGFKLIEEVGELFQKMLLHKKYGSKKKLDNHDKENIQKEFADVMIVLFILARDFGVDIEKAIKIKIDEIKKRLLE